MDDYVPGVVCHGQVVLGEGGLACIEGRLVAKSKSTVTDRCGDINQGRAGEVHVCSKDQLLVLVVCLQLARLSPSVRLEAGVEGELEAGHQLLVINYCVEAAKISIV